MLEAIAKIADMTGKKLAWNYVEEARKGDHICYISDLRKFQSHYPNWEINRNLDTIFQEIIAAQQAEQKSSRHGGIVQSAGCRVQSAACSRDTGGQG